MSKLDLSRRRALDTGGARGLRAGRAQARADAGARVMIADVLQDVGGQTAAELPGGGFVPLDVTDDAAWGRAVVHTVAELGGLDIVVDNAGIEVTQLIVESPDTAVVGLTPSGRLGDVSDMADAVVFLASDAARSDNGVGLPVVGGM